MTPAADEQDDDRNDKEEQSSNVGFSPEALKGAVGHPGENSADDPPQTDRVESLAHSDTLDQVDRGQIASAGTAATIAQCDDDTGTVQPAAPAGSSAATISETASDEASAAQTTEPAGGSATTIAETVSDEASLAQTTEPAGASATTIAETVSDEGSAAQTTEPAGEAQTSGELEGYSSLFPSYGTTVVAIVLSSALALLLIPSNFFGNKLSFGISVMALFAILFQLLTLLFGTFSFGTWITRAYENLNLAGVKNLRGSGKWFAYAAAIPIANIFVSHNLLQEIWKASSPGATVESVSESQPSPAVFCWALAWILSTQLTSWLLLWADFQAGALKNTIIDAAWVLGSVAYAVAGALCIVAMKQVTRRQEVRFGVRVTTGQEACPGVVNDRSSNWNTIVLMCALMSVVPPAVSAVGTYNAFTVLSVARDSYDAGNYDQALARLSQIPAGAATWVVTQPFNIFKAQCYSKQGKFKEAIDELNAIIKADAFCTDAWIARGEAFHDREQYLSAVSDFTHAIEESPTNLQAYYDRSLTYFTMKQYNDAMQDIDKALDLEPNNEKSHSLRGDVLTAREQFQEAINEYQHANKLTVDLSGNHVENADLLYNIAVCHQNLKDQINAQKYFRDAARVYRENGMNEEAKDAEAAAAEVKEPELKPEENGRSDLKPIPSLPIRELPLPPDLR